MNQDAVCIYLVAAMATNRVIGNGPNIPWKIPGEQTIFRRLTEGKVVAMGRKTFESIGKPLPNRHTIVISRQTNYRAAGCSVASNLSEALSLAAAFGNELYVAGGAEIYSLALPHAHGVFLSEVHQTFDGDAFFPQLDEKEFEAISSSTVQASIPYTHTVYVRRNVTRKCLSLY
ncbi:dihydrofolate reductase [Thiobacillus sp. 0-1251]|uniref:dihydrofolate reductase n=1 Tax=Thiobacillus sp. 0-1251 TaxID=1895858 RepID=UPI00095A4978|nr:dihydrofolate reductase [Thiobacillus sp. 0-1251]OJY60406.1 MAG: dihydrofolate reductase [Thiobacillus sp. 0-1251]